MTVTVEAFHGQLVDVRILDQKRQGNSYARKILLALQGSGRIGKLPLETPAMIHFGQETADEVFITHEAAHAGVEVENTGNDALVSLRYFGPKVHKNLPRIGASG